jgi:hypothetical protein
MGIDVTAMKPLGSIRGTTVRKSRPPSEGGRWARVSLRSGFLIAALVPLVFTVSACSGVEQVGSSLWSKIHRSSSSSTSGARGFIRVEDLPVAPPPDGFVRPEDLARAAPSAVRPLRPEELTPQLIRRADDVLKNHEKPLGGQVVVDVGDKIYIARFEWHHHDESYTEGPRGWHKGVTLYTTE